MITTPATASLFSTKTPRIRRAMLPWETTSPPPGLAVASSESSVDRRSSSPTEYDAMDGDAGSPISTCVARTRSSGFCIPDPRVHDCVQDVGQEVADDGRDGHDERHAEQRRDVLAERRVHGEQPHARVVEHALSDDGAANDGAEREPEQRDDGDD